MSHISSQSNLQIFILVVCRAINKAIELLRQRHQTHIKRYGRDNERRLTGHHETASVSLSE